MSNLTPEEKKNAFNKMESVAANWFIKDFMLLGVWSMVDKLVDPKMPTIGLDTRHNPPRIRYNPKFINTLDIDTLEKIMGIECIKLLLRHPTTRLKHPLDVSALSSSITVDQIVFKDVEKAMKDIIPFPENYNIEEKDANLERYFRLLMEKYDQTEKNMDKQFGQKKEKGDEDEDKDKKKGGSKSKSPGQGEESPDGQPGEGQGDGEDGEGEGHGSGSGQGDSDDFQEFKNSKDALKNHMDPRNGQNSHWGDNEGLDAEIENFVHQNKGSSKQWGSMSADFLTSIVAANTPKISWKEIVRRFKNSVQTSKSFATRMKYNRRFGWDAPGRKRINTTKILFAIDVSGSMSDEDIAEGFAVVNSVCRHAIVHWMTFDTEIKQVETKMKKAQNMFKVCGRGGTDPAPVLKYADEHKYDGVVIYSDLDFYGDQKEPRCRVLWLGADRRDTNPTSFGFFAKLERD